MAMLSSPRRHSSATYTSDPAILDTYCGWMEYSRTIEEEAVDSLVPSRNVTPVIEQAEAEDVTSSEQSQIPHRLAFDDATNKSIDHGPPLTPPINRDRSLSFISSSSCRSASSDDSVETYYEPDNRQRATNIDRRVRELEERMKGVARTPSQRRAHLHLELGEEPEGFEQTLYLAYMASHRGDLPYRERCEESRRRERTQMQRSPDDVEQVQNELFGGWTWPAKATAERDLPDVVRPRRESMSQITDTPKRLKCWRAKSVFREHVEDLEQMKPEVESSRGSSAVPEKERKHSRSPMEWLKGVVRELSESKGSR